jgi:hypothetical protein
MPLSVQIWKYGEDNEHLGSWYSDEQAQVPRRGDIVWLDTDKHRHGRWKVAEVQWSFRDTTHGIGRTRLMTAEVHVKPYPTTPLWRRFVGLFPSAAVVPTPEKP